MQGLYPFKKRLSLLLFLSASYHLCARDITCFIDEVEIAFFSLETAFGYFLGLSPLVLAPCHFRAGNITLLVKIVEVSLFSFDSYFQYFLCHVLFTSSQKLKGLTLGFFLKINLSPDPRWL